MISANAIQDVATLNKVFMAYFIHMSEKNGVDWFNTRPTVNPTKDMASGRYFVADDVYAHQKDFIMINCPIEVDLKLLRIKGIEDFFDNSMKDRITDIAIHFSNEVKKWPDCDFVFSLLPDFQPFITDCSHDTDTGFIARSIYGRDLMNDTGRIVFEFYCMFVDRLREMGDDIIGVVAKMTLEDKERYDKQPEVSDE